MSVFTVCRGRIWILLARKNELPMTIWQRPSIHPMNGSVSEPGLSSAIFAAEGEYTSDLGYKAALDALDNAGMDAQEIDLIICATATPDNTFSCDRCCDPEYAGYQSRCCL